MDSLIIELKHSQNDSIRVKTLWDISAYYRNCDIVKSLEYSLQALELANKIEDSYLIGLSYNRIGNAFFFIGNNNEALNNYLKSLRIFEEINDEVYLFSCYNNLGAVTYKLLDYDKALDYFFDAQAIYNHSSSGGKSVLSTKIPPLYNNIGNIYGVKNENESALEYYKIALRNATTLNDHSILGIIYNNLGKLYLKMNKEEEALDNLHFSLQHRKRINDLYGMGKSYNFFAHYYIETGNPDKALEAVKKSEEYFRMAGTKSLKSRQEAALHKFKIFGSKQQYKKALEANIQYNQLSDSLQNEASIKDQMRLNLQYEFEKKEKEGEIRQQKKHLRYLFLMAVLILLVVIIGLLYVFLKSRSQRIILEKHSLEKDLELKNKELTSNATYLLKKNELIKDISNRLLHLKSRLKKENVEPLQKIILDLQAGVEQDIWQEFEFRIQQMDNEFYNYLQEKFPELTPYDKRLVAFLRLNMTTKEIGTITRQSSRSLEVARHRLRKKLGIANKEVNLVNFLCDL